MVFMSDEQYQWVHSSKGGGRGYWRRLARTASDPTSLQAAQRLRMSLLSNKLPSAQGTTQLRDGRHIPLNAALISPLLRGSPDVPEITEEIPVPPPVPYFRKVFHPLH